MNNELNLYTKTYKIHKNLEGGGKSKNIKEEDEKDINIIRKYRKRCLELSKENKELKKEIIKLKKDLENKI